MDASFKVWNKWKQKTRTCAHTPAHTQTTLTSSSLATQEFPISRFSPCKKEELMSRANYGFNTHPEWEIMNGCSWNYKLKASAGSSFSKSQSVAMECLLFSYLRLLSVAALTCSVSSSHYPHTPLPIRTPRPATRDEAGFKFEAFKREPWTLWTLSTAVFISEESVQPMILSWYHNRIYSNSLKDNL